MSHALSAIPADTPFEQFVEELRVKAFRIYEAVRAVQRERDAGDGERLRKLAVSGSLAADLAEQIMLATPRTLPIAEDRLERDLPIAVGL